MVAYDEREDFGSWAVKYFEDDNMNGGDGLVPVVRGFLVKEGISKSQKNNFSKDIGLLLSKIERIRNIQTHFLLNLIWIGNLYIKLKLKQRREIKKGIWNSQNLKNRSLLYKTTNSKSNEVINSKKGIKNMNRFERIEGGMYNSSKRVFSKQDLVSRLQNLENFEHPLSKMSKVNLKKSLEHFMRTVEAPLVNNKEIVHQLR